MSKDLRKLHLAVNSMIMIVVAGLIYSALLEIEALVPSFLAELSPFVV